MGFRHRQAPAVGSEGKTQFYHVSGYMSEQAEGGGCRASSFSNIIVYTMHFITFDTRRKGGHHWLPSYASRDDARDRRV